MTQQTGKHTRIGRVIAIGCSAVLLLVIVCVLWCVFYPAPAVVGDLVTIPAVSSDRKKDGTKALFDSNGLGDMQNNGVAQTRLCRATESWFSTWVDQSDSVTVPPAYRTLSSQNYGVDYSRCI